MGVLMSNWLQKLASITFTINDAHRISQPKTVSDLSVDLSNFAREKYGISGSLYDLQPDGFDDQNMTGTINWYIRPETVSEDKQLEIINAWIADKNITGYQFKVRGPEISGQSQWNSEAAEDLKVFRIDVLVNGSEDYTQIPELNVSNNNAVAVLGMLNIPFNYAGTMDLRRVRSKLATLTEAKMREFTQEDEIDGPHISFGRDLDRLQRYVVELTKIVDFGLSNGFTHLRWS